MPSLRFSKEPACGCHPDNATKLAFWNPREISNVFDRNAHFRRDTGEELEFTKPLETGEQFHLLGLFRLAPCLEKKEEEMSVGIANLRSKMLKKVGGLAYHLLDSCHSGKNVGPETS
jgi:hypothetical protein